jgi:hypothetical protein
MKNGNNGSATVTVPRAGDIGKMWYSDTCQGLETALVDSITSWIGDKVYKSPSVDPNDPDGVIVNLIVPVVYAGYVPSQLLSPDGIRDPPSAPSVLVEAHSGRVMITGRYEARHEEYEVSARVVITLWDDAPDYTGYQDHRYLKEMLYFKLLQFRTLQERFLLGGTAEWKNIACGHNNYFISVIELDYRLGAPPDASDSVDIDIEDNNFLFDGELVVKSTPSTDLIPCPEGGC